MSLKRLLNPDDGTDTHVGSRPIQGWDDYGAPIDIAPVLQETTWENCVTDLFSLDSLPDILSQDQIDPYSLQHGFDIDSKASLLFVEEQVQRWAEDNVSSHPTSPGPQDRDEKQIARSPVKLIGDMSVVDSKLASGDGQPIPGHFQMLITKAEDRYLVGFPDGTLLGEANALLEEALESIEKQRHRVDLEAFAPIRPIRETIYRATKEKEAVVRVNINIYGPSSVTQEIGSILSSKKIYLQRPDYIKPGMSYENPHVLKLGNFQHSFHSQEVDLRTEQQPESEVAKAEAFQKTIDTIYSSLTRGQTLAGLEGDDRLKTQLLTHQKQALHFMSQRENGPIPEKFRLWVPSEQDGRPCQRHVITNNASLAEYSETGGGILADEMGMGKSLSILALILRTLGDGHKWASEHDTMLDNGSSHYKSRRRSRATLVIASSDLMINEWFQEMKIHFEAQIWGALRTVKYHGTNRESNIDTLAESDIVVTTYHTLYMDSQRGKNPLRDIEWYRLVLDEAHIIRRLSTVFYRTVAELKARSRWCLTGTPIQNRLEDIGSLFAFIRIIPFNNPSNFRKYISVPFDEGGKRRDLAIERFTRLLDSLCLRRTKDLLHLPEQHSRVRKLEFSAEERMQYEQTKKIMLRAAKNQVGGFDQKSTLGLFQVQLQLRILCNHGTFQQPFSWNRRKMHLLDEREAMEASSGRDGEVTCSACKQTMPLLGAGSMFRRFDEHCRHVLCSECMEESMPEANPGVVTNCPLCSSLWKITSRSANSTFLQQEDGRYFRAQGRSSKIQALMEDVRVDIWSTKSIIFSCWTHTLDLIGSALGQLNITFRRIDGECPTAKREKILDEFAHDPSLRVLIMTTGTGAVGLNLATANRVFLVEPQWNPSVENQAIARALRLGQEQAVQVTRYVVNGTVEQDMRSLQDRKLKMAHMAWE
ncbi:SNF2 family domain-containing protein [Paraphaeosphaeria sporulosa]